jgi:predicted esterase
VLAIAGASDKVVPLLRKAGYDVTYRRFRGGHEVSPATSAAAVRWFLAGLS